MPSAREVQELIEDRPDLEPAIEEALSMEGPFQFDDIDLDSGTFGELVSSGIIIRSDNTYRVENHEEIRRGLRCDINTEDTTRSTLSVPTISVSHLEAVTLVAAILLVISFRVISIPTVFREGHVVLSSNDPYYYRYLVEQLLVNPDITPSTLGSSVVKGEPLMVVSLWTVSMLLGGTKEITGHVLAWYPVVSAVITAIILYSLTTILTNDRRIAFASVLMLAIIPVHAFRTSLGFADHHPFDYPWLAFSVLALTLIIRETTETDSPIPGKSAIFGILLIGLATAAQTLAWDNSPILLAVLGVVVTSLGLHSLSQNRNPAYTLLPITFGLAIASGIVWLIHQQLFWHTALVASSPILLLVGTMFVLVSNEVVHRLKFPWLGGMAVDLVGGVVGIYLFQSFRPDYWSRLISSVSERLVSKSGIAEVLGIFSDSLGWLFLFGLMLLLSVPYLTWATYRSRFDAKWIPVVIYGWYFLILAAIQGRFAGQLSIPLAVFSGLAFVHMAERIDVSKAPAPFTGTGGRTRSVSVPSKKQVGALLILFMLVGSLSFVQIPIKTNQLTTATGQSDAAFWIANDNENRDLEYPENYVLSNWGDARMYNYFVNGESASYNFAREHYAPFVRSTNEERWFQTLEGRVGYVVTSPLVVGNRTQLGSRLQDNNGSATSNSPGMGHFRLRYISDQGNYKVYELVSGARITGRADPNSTIGLSTKYRVHDQPMVYHRNTVSNRTGYFEIRVSQPGIYRINDRKIEVRESEIRNGTTVTVQRQKDG